MATEYLGAVKIFAGNFAIKGYAMCQGQLLSIQQNSALFSLLGTQFGGNGIQNFALPDLRSRLPIGQGNGAGLSPRTIGEVGGTEGVVLSTANVPTHNHTFNASTTTATTGTAGSGVLFGAMPSGQSNFYAQTGSPSFAFATMAATAVANSGGNQPHNNIQSSLGINYIIALTGIFPSRN